MDSLFNDMSELRYLQRSLLQRIQTFDRIKRWGEFVLLTMLHLNLTNATLLADSRIDVTLAQFNVSE